MPMHERQFLSGCDNSILDLGVVPQIKGVIRFPADAHEHISHASKIPTVIYCDRAGNLKAVGAQAVQDGIYRLSRTEIWVKAGMGRFKLHLTSRANNGDVPLLPLDKIVVEVFADFLVYLLECASTYIQDSYGVGIWASVQSSYYPTQTDGKALSNLSCVKLLSYPGYPCWEFSPLIRDRGRSEPPLCYSIRPSDWCD